MPPPTTRNKLEDVLERAQMAFWEEVAIAFPEIKTGDVDPLESARFDRSCEIAVRSWIDGNLTLGVVPGTRWRLKQDVDRGPHFVAHAGLAGTIHDDTGLGEVYLRLDDPLPGAEDNCVIWTEAEDPDEISGVYAFVRDAERI